jgi:hypothetical protein
MNPVLWEAFAAARARYKEIIRQTERALPNLGELQQELVNHRSGPAYTVETPVVYNGALDDISAGDRIKLILVADNPGRREQAAENRRYLVGPSGKIAEKFFRDNPGLGIDFRQQVIILNKTPVHTPRTADLRELCRMGGPALNEAIDESQRTMAELLFEFHRCLSPAKSAQTGGRVWIIGYSEMKPGGIFQVYTETLAARCKQERKRRSDIRFYRHFSMNQFTIDLNRQAVAGETLQESLDRIGGAYRERILGW